MEKGRKRKIKKVRYNIEFLISRTKCNAKNSIIFSVLSQRERDKDRERERETKK